MNAILTVCIGNTYENFAKITHPSIKKYAEKIKAEFIVIDKTKISNTTPHFEKFQIYDLLNKYERILYVDTDLIIREDCPNLFEIVPEHKLGMLDEGKFQSRTDAICAIAKEYNEQIKNWDGKYYNSGVMVISRIHKQLFKKPQNEVCNFYEQSYLNLRIINDKITMHDLDYKFNRLSCMDKHLGEHRLCSYIVHYAGVGIPDKFGKLHVNLNQLIPSDLEKWNNKEYLYYKKHAVIAIGHNRLGDHVATEPVVRFIINNSKDTKFIVMSSYPSLYRHLNCESVLYDDYDYLNDMPYLFINIGVPEDNMMHKYFNGNIMHNTDYFSLAATKRILNDKDKQIILKPTNKGFEEVINIAAGKLDNMILIHPGSGWQSKTFPKKWWDEVINELSKLNKNIGVIGKNCLIKDNSKTKEIRLGYVDVDIPDNVVDFRDLLSIDGLVALISMCPVLITNDSAPLHIAGAFDNKIILIPTCKHPDLIMPYRHGNKSFNAISLYKKIMFNEINLDLTGMSEYNRQERDGIGNLHKEIPIDKFNGNWDEILPNPIDVVNEAIKGGENETTSR